MSGGKRVTGTGITDPGYNAEFDRLQKKLVPLWKSIERFNQDPQTIVVVPSMSIDAIHSGAVMQAYEERFLFLLLLLRQPRARLIYVTSQTILPSIIDTEANRKAMPKADYSKWPKPEEIARVILFLCSEDAKLVHGAAIPV